jgi:hypothetical protein
LYSELAAENLPPTEINNVFSLIAGPGNGQSPTSGEVKLQNLIAKAVTDSIDEVFLIPLIMGCIAFCIALITERVTLVRNEPIAKLDPEEEEGLLQGPGNAQR